MGLFGSVFKKAIKKVGGIAAGIASYAVPGVGSKLLSGVSSQLLKPSLVPAIANSSQVLQQSSAPSVIIPLSPIKASSQLLVSDAPPQALNVFKESEIVSRLTIGKGGVDDPVYTTQQQSRAVNPMYLLMGGLLLFVFLIFKKK